jgi:putative sterol carrier protein
MTAKEFILGLPVQVNPEALAGKPDTTFHFKLDGEGGGDFTAAIKSGKLEIAEGLQGEANCVVTSTAQVLMEIIRKERNPQMALFTGKLKVSNLGEVMKYGKAFGIM